MQAGPEDITFTHAPGGYILTANTDRGRAWLYRAPAATDPVRVDTADMADTVGRAMMAGVTVGGAA